MSNTLTHRFRGQCKLKGRCCGLHCRTELLSQCAGNQPSDKIANNDPPHTSGGFWSAVILPILSAWRTSMGISALAKPLTKAPESLSIAVRVQQWTEVLFCHARGPSCSTSSGASEIPQQPFLIKFDDTFRSMLHKFAWERLTRHRRALAGVLQRLQCGRCQVRLDHLPTPCELLTTRRNAPIVRRDPPRTHGSQSTNAPNHRWKMQRI